MNCAVLDCHYPAIHRAWAQLGSHPKRFVIAVCHHHHEVALGLGPPRVPRGRQTAR